MNEHEKPLDDVLITLSENAAKAVGSAIEGSQDFFAKRGEVPSAIIAIPEGGVNPKVFDAVHHNDEEKQCVWAFLRFIRETHPVVILVSEIWASRCNKGQDPYKLPRPSKDPNRFEMVMLSLWDGNRNVLIAADITRKPDKLGEFTVRMDSFDDECKIEGTLSEGKGYYQKGDRRYGR